MKIITNNTYKKYLNTIKFDNFLKCDEKIYYPLINTIHFSQRNDTIYYLLIGKKVSTFTFHCISIFPYTKV